MPELRKDPVIGRWVIISAERVRRPERREAEDERQDPAFCPFCEGNEPKTPPEIIARRAGGSHANGPGWQVRVVPNKFPALQVEGGLEKRGVGIYDRMNGIGAHEVVIESPKHLTSFTELSDDNAREVLLVYKERVLDLSRDQRMNCAMIFKNVGEAAGASLEHTHSQIIVTPVVPRTIRQEMEGCRQFHDYRGRCIFCDMLEQESAEGARVVASTQGFLAFGPYAPRFPFETWIVPRRHASHYEDITPAEAGELAGLMRKVLGKIEKGLGRPAYNYMVHTSPLRVDRNDYYHWHIEIIPRLNSVAGFEWGSGFYINPVPPESAAEFLRDI